MICIRQVSENMQNILWPKQCSIFHGIVTFKSFIILFIQYRKLIHI